MKFFDSGMTFGSLLGGKIDPYYITDLTNNYNRFYHLNISWPYKYSIYRNVNALDAILSI